MKCYQSILDKLNARLTTLKPHQWREQNDWKKEFDTKVSFFKKKDFAQEIEAFKKTETYRLCPVYKRPKTPDVDDIDLSLKKPQDIPKWKAEVCKQIPREKRPIRIVQDEDIKSFQASALWHKYNAARTTFRIEKIPLPNVNEIRR